VEQRGMVSYGGGKGYYKDGILGIPQFYQ